MRREPGRREALRHPSPRGPDHPCRVTRYPPARSRALVADFRPPRGLYVLGLCGEKPPPLPSAAPTRPSKRKSSGEGCRSSGINGCPPSWWVRRRGHASVSLCAPGNAGGRLSTDVMDAYARHACRSGAASCRRLRRQRNRPITARPPPNRGSAAGRGVEMKSNVNCVPFIF